MYGLYTLSGTGGDGAGMGYDWRVTDDSAVGGTVAAMTGTRSAGPSEDRADPSDALGGGNDMGRYACGVTT